MEAETKKQKGFSLKAFTRDVDMLNGPLFSGIWVYALPLMLSGMLQLVYNAADVAVVGHFAADSKTALAAVGSTGSLTNLIVGLFLGLSVGTNVVISRYMGTGDEKGISETIHTSVLTSLVFGVILSAVGILGAPTFLSLMKVDETVINLSALYMRIYFIGMPASMLYNFCSSILRAKGDTRFPFITLVIAGLVNVALNLLTVIVFHLDVAGVALATMTSQVVSAIMVSMRLVSMKDCFHLDFRKLKIYPDKIRKIIRIGLPAGAQSVLFSITNVIIQTAVNSLGPDAMAGNTAAANIDGFIYIACNSVYHAAIAFTGQNYGARKYARVRKVCIYSIIVVTLVGLFLGAVATIFTDALLELYAPGWEKAYIRELGALRLKIMAVTYFMCGLMEVATGLMRGIGSSFIPMVISVFGSCVLRIAWIQLFFYRLEFFHTMDWLYFTYPISWGLTLAAEYIAFAIVFRKKCRRHGVDPKHLKDLT